MRNLLLLLALWASCVSAQDVIGAGHRSLFTPPHGNQTQTASTAAGWTNPTNVFVLDQVYATTTIAQNGNSPNLTVSNFGFTIPNNAVIAGVVVTIYHFDENGNGDLQDHSVNIMKALSVVGSNKAIVTPWAAGSEESYTYGGTSDLWGTTLTPSDVNGSGFGILFTAHNSTSVDGPQTAGIDYVSITVYY